jgi:hypothetical protein
MNRLQSTCTLLLTAFAIAACSASGGESDDSETQRGVSKDGLEFSYCSSGTCFAAEDQYRGDARCYGDAASQAMLDRLVSATQSRANQSGLPIRYSAGLVSPGKPVSICPPAGKWNAQANPVEVPVAPTGCGNMATGTTLAVGNSIYSCDKRFMLNFQPEGNLVLYQLGSVPVALWSTPVDASADKLVMQKDGNLALYNKSGLATFSTNTANQPGAKAYIQDDGNFVVYSAANVPLWYTGTGGR